MRGFQGQFTLFRKNTPPLVIPNTVVKNGAEIFLQLLFQAIDTNMPATFYLGLTNASYTYDSADLTDIMAGEPAGNGYARQALNRDDTDWDVSEVNGLMRARSKVCDFTASANWDKTWSRMFLCDRAADDAGFVFALSGPTVTPQTVLSGDAPSLRYEFWNRI